MADDDNSARGSRSDSFALGLAVGIGASLLALAGAIAALRRRRPEQGDSERKLVAAAAAPLVFPPPHLQGETRAIEEAELDEELAQTFPASDPLPTSHRVD